MAALDAILTGMFTGFGVITGQWIFEKYFKQKLEKIHDKTPTINLKKVLNGEIEITTRENKNKTTTITETKT